MRRRRRAARGVDAHGAPSASSLPAEERWNCETKQYRCVSMAATPTIDADRHRPADRAQSGAGCSRRRPSCSSTTGVRGRHRRRGRGTVGRGQVDAVPPLELRCTSCCSTSMRANVPEPAPIDLALGFEAALRSVDRPRGRSRSRRRTGRGRCRRCSSCATHSPEMAELLAADFDDQLVDRRVDPRARRSGGPASRRASIPVR